MQQSIANIRKDYKLKTLDEKDVAHNAIDQFTRWWEEAVNSCIDEVNAMTLATINETGLPSARIVLLKDYSKEGFVFYTNYESKKGNELSKNNGAALVFFWKELERQIRITGIAEKVTAQESDEYFASRPQGSKAGAWASNQSTIIKDRASIEDQLQHIELKYRDNNIPRPPHWGGYIIKPIQIEFWQGRSNRLHDRILYTKTEEHWKIERLSP